MFEVVLTVHIVLCVMLILLVLLQQGKGADIGATFGRGASDTIFGTTGLATTITKVTTAVAVSFMITSILLVRMYRQKVYLRSKAPSAVETDLLKGSAVVKHAPAGESAQAPKESKEQGKK